MEHCMIIFICPLVFKQSKERFWSLYLKHGQAVIVIDT